jgi:hypothetical protein
MIEPRPEALVVEAVLRLLRASGEEALAKVVSASTLERLPGTEIWNLDQRSVDAHRFALVVTPEDFVWVKGRSEAVDELRKAFAAVVDSPSTRLASLSLVVALDGGAGAHGAMARTWASVYRTAAPEPEPPAEPGRVRATATALAHAYGDPVAARLLVSAELLRAELSESEGITLVRWVVRLRPDDLALAERETSLGDRVLRCVTHAATRATERVGEVELRARDA